MRAAGRRSERWEREAAAELDDPKVHDVAFGDLAREHLAARPQLGPVREKLLVLERLLIEERFGVARAQDRQRPRRQSHVRFDEVELSQSFT